MINFRALLEVLYRPNKAYSELKGGVGWRDGLLVYVICSILALLVFGSLASGTGWNTMMIDFGFGAALSYSSVLFFVLHLVIFISVVGISNFLALKWGGKGSFSETLGMFAYSRILTVFQAFFSGVLLLLMFSKTMTLLGLAVEDTTLTPIFFEPIMWSAIVLIFVFMIWGIWIYSNALSVSHELSIIKSIIVVVVTTLVINIAVDWLISLGGFL